MENHQESLQRRNYLFRTPPDFNINKQIKPLGKVSLNPIETPFI
jgi:hypothetical protein